MCVPELIRINSLIDWLITTEARFQNIFLAASAAKFWVARRRKHFQGCLAIFLVAQISPKRGILVHKNSLASRQRCRHSVEPRALTCSFKHSNMIAWSLLNWHPTHKYLWGRLYFFQTCCLLSTVTITPAETRIMSTEVLLTLLEAPTGTLFFYYKDIKQEIVHTLQLEEYSVSKKWVIIMDMRQDLNVTSTPAGNSGPSAQDRYCARGGIEMVLCDGIDMVGIEMVGIEMVLCDMYLKRFDRTKGLLFKTFVITVWYKLCRCDHSVLEFKSFPLLINW